MLFQCNPSTMRINKMSTTTAVKTINLTDIAFPKKCNVILLNDDVTPMEFVIEVLIGLFGHTNDTAEKVMLSMLDT